MNNKVIGVIAVSVLCMFMVGCGEKKDVNNGTNNNGKNIEIVECKEFADDLSFLETKEFNKTSAIKEVIKTSSAKKTNALYEYSTVINIDEAKFAIGDDVTEDYTYKKEIISVDTFMDKYGLNEEDLSNLNMDKSCAIRMTKFLSKDEKEVACLFEILDREMLLLATKDAHFFDIADFKDKK